MPGAVQDMFTSRSSSPLRQLSESPARSPASPTGNLPAAKLSRVTEKFSSLYSELEQERQARRQEEHQRQRTVQETLNRLEDFVHAQTQKQQDAQAQLRSYVDAEIKAMHDRVSAQLRDSQLGLKTGLDAANRSLQDVKDALREEREQRISDMEFLSQSVAGKSEECMAAVEDVRLTTLEREAQSLKRIGDEVYHLQQQMDGERLTRETTLGQLQSELQQLLSGRHAIDEKFQQLVLEEISTLKGDIDLERSERLQEDDQIVVAINEYTLALQDGLRIVSS